MPTPRIHFDHLSGSPIEPGVLEAMLPFLTTHFAGTGAVHSGGVQVRAALDLAREKVAAFINAASPEEIIFTSSGTESTNLAIKGCALANQRRGKKIILTALEHPSVLQSAAFLETLGFTTHTVPVSPEGFVDPAAISAALDDHTILVCAHAGNHDIGAIQNLTAISDIVSEHGSALFIDATYAAGWMPLDAQATNASYMAIAPHRFGGPKGVGILYKQRRARLTPLLHGGAQELGWRAGTENIPGAIGAGVACELAKKEMPARIAHVQSLQTKLWSGLEGQIDGLRLNGPSPGPTRVPNSLNLSLTGLEGEGLALALDMKGIQITSGQACATKAQKIPPSLAAIGVPEDYAAGTIILSFNKKNTSTEIDRFLEIFPSVIQRLRDLNG